MMLSVMVVGAGAAFSDQSKIKNTEAVDACTALNIIGGYPDGSFKPEGNITRAEVTKMICVALNGGKNPAVSTNTTPTFSDVRNNANAAWAEGYIESCAAQGIVSGVGGGKFAPNGNVTGVQLAKMLLVSLGYKSENEGFTGNAWATNVNTIASAKGLYEGLEKLDVSAALTRDSAARMIWNALQAYEVEYKTSLIAGPDGKLATQITVQDKVVGSTNDKITLLRDKYDAWVNVGTLISVNNKTITISMSPTDQAGSDLIKVDANGAYVDDAQVEFSKLDTDYSALLGQKVKVIFKNGKTNDVIGVYATGDNNSYTVNASDVENDKGDIKFNDKTYKVELTSGALKTYIDGQAASANKTVANLVAMNNTANVLTLIDTNDNDKIDTVYVKTVTVEKVTYASSSQIVAGGKTYKYADENIASGVKKDDWVVISENNYNDNKDITIAEKKTGVAIQGTKGDAPNYTEVRIDGTWYYVAAGKSLKDIKAGNTADVVVVNGVLFDAKKTSGTSAGMPDVLMVLAKGTGLDNNKIKFVLPDGTIKTEEYKLGTASDVVDGTVYAWEMDGSKYKLNALEGSTSTDTDDYTKLNADSTVLKSAPGTEIAEGATVKYVGKSGNTATGAVEIADSAKVIIGYGADSKIVTGKQFKALTFSSGMVSALGTGKKAAAAYTSKVDGLTRVSLLFVKQTAEPSGFNTNDNYGYVVKDAYASGDNYYTFTMWNGTNNVDVKTKTSGVKAGDIIGYSSIDDKSEIQDLKNYGSKSDTDLKLGSITGVNSKKDGIVFNGKSDYLNITKDTVILYVDSKNGTAEKIGVAGDKTAIDSYILDDTDDVYAINAKYIMDGSEDIAVLVVDVLGEMKLANDDMKTVTLTKTAARLASMTAVTSDNTTVTSGSTTVEQGEILTVTMTGATAAGDVTVSLVGAKFTGDATASKDFTVSNNGTVTFSVIVTGSTAVSITATNK